MQFTRSYLTRVMDGTYQQNKGMEKWAECFTPWQWLNFSSILPPCAWSSLFLNLNFYIFNTHTNHLLSHPFSYPIIQLKKGKFSHEREPFRYIKGKAWWKEVFITIFLFRNMIISYNLCQIYAKTAKLAEKWW